MFDLERRLYVEAHVVILTYKLLTWNSLKIKKLSLEYDECFCLAYFLENNLGNFFTTYNDTKYAIFVHTIFAGTTRLMFSAYSFFQTIAIFFKAAVLEKYVKWIRYTYVLFKHNYSIYRFIVWIVHICFISLIHGLWLW